MRVDRANLIGVAVICLVCSLLAALSFNRHVAGRATTPSPTPVSVAPAQVKVCGLQLGMTIAQATRCRPELAGRLSQGRSSGPAGSDVVTIDFSPRNQLTMIYGESMSVGDRTFRSGDSLEKITDLLGQPDAIQDVDQSPDHMLSYQYEHLKLNVAAERDHSRAGGFILDVRDHKI